MTVDLVNPDYPLNIAITANSSSYSSTEGVISKFESAQPFVCPIISYEISKVLDSKNNGVDNYAEFVKLEADNNTLTLIKTDTVIDYKIYIMAKTSSVSSVIDDNKPTATVTIVEGPNFAPYFMPPPEASL